MIDGRMNNYGLKVKMDQNSSLKTSNLNKMGLFGAELSLLIEHEITRCNRGEIKRG